MVAHLTVRQALDWLDDHDAPQSVRDFFLKPDESPEVLGVVCFQNTQLDSSQCGACSYLKILVDGTLPPSRLREMEANPMAFFLNDLPSQRQYPVWYALVDDKSIDELIEEEKEAANG